VEALATGIGIALVAALAPALEASRVSPVEAMARGQREHRAQSHVRRNLLLAAILAAGALWAVRQGPVDGKPIFGYAACFLMVAAVALLIPPALAMASPIFAAIARKALSVEPMLAARSIHASTLRSSILIAALGTAIAMMVSVGVMVGSFRQTVDTWMHDQLRADFYLRPAGTIAAGRFPTFAGDVMDRVAALPMVAAIDRFRAYEIHYRGLPALFGAGEIDIVRRFGMTEFLHGDREAILGQLAAGDVCIVSEPFANKHGVREGDLLELALAGRTVTFRVAGVYHDYSNERGYVIVDRATLLNVNCSVRTGDGRPARGFGSMPLGNIWSFPSKTMSYDTTLKAMQALAEQIASTQRAVTSVFFICFFKVGARSARVRFLSIARAAVENHLLARPVEYGLCPLV